MKPIPFLLLCCFALGCSQREPFHPAPYHWQDSLVDCEVSHDHLTIVFPAKPEATHWMVECVIEHDTQSVYLPPFAVTANDDDRLEIDLDLPDSVPPSQMKITHLRMGPVEGVYMCRTKSGYFMDALQMFQERDSTNRHFRLYPFLQKMQWFVVHDSLLYGNDSSWYQVQFALFMHDSISSEFPVP